MFAVFLSKRETETHLLTPFFKKKKEEEKICAENSLRSPVIYDSSRQGLGMEPMVYYSTTHGIMCVLQITLHSFVKME
jgi:hypothetical protein